ncbi:MAG TPA: FkbM family methyltransferase [Xanthobacteraceae bacterium]|nr:FkbM family methyltransferase [Xanthobacteraceae bacterium]
MLTTRQKIALARMAQRPVVAARRLAALGPVARVRRRGVNWSLDLREGIDFSIWLLGAFELATVQAYERLVAPGSIVLDIGANVGAHTLHLARAVGARGKVWAIEPTDYAIGKLRTNIALNPELSDRIACCQVMLVETDDRVAVPPLHSSWPLTGERDLHERHGGRLMPADNARALTLDSLLRELGIGPIDFIKLDIDGHECEMLRGAQGTLRASHPTIVLELSPHQLDENGGSIEGLIDLLASAGYGLQDLASRAPLPMNGTALRALIPHGASRNAIAAAAARK